MRNKMNNNFKEDGTCKSCGWYSEFPGWHSVYYHCDYVISLYDISFDDDGKAIFTLKSKKRK